jgi:AcrR family transcriptional regulator
VNAASAKTAVAVNRSDRRKAHTRQALIEAAVRLIAEGRGERATVQEITEAADIGLGSFYNHFASKEKLFQTASEQVLESWGKIIDDSCREVDDPAQVFAVSLRISGRLAWTNPVIAHFITAAGLDLLDIPGGLAARALRDIRACEAVGRFTALDANVALSAVAGGLLGLLRLQERERERVDKASVDALAESCLRLLGIDAAEAHRLTRLPLPRVAGLDGAGA